MEYELTQATLAERKRWLTDPAERYRREWEAAQNIAALETRATRARRRLDGGMVPSRLA